MKNKRYWWFGLLAGIAAVILLVSGVLWLRNRLSGPREAPEAEQILVAQAGVPFQVLIPAYLPAGFDRKQVEIQTEQTGPSGEPMVSLTYTTRAGIKLTLNEWIPLNLETTGGAGTVSESNQEGVSRCSCFCKDQNLCSITRLMVEIGSLRIMGETSHPEILSLSLVQTILRTLAPASGLVVLSSLEDVPLSSGLPPPVDATLDSSGVQEIVLVISQEGYTPVHFAVKKDIPVRLVFKQLGEVGCGNELWIEWGTEQPGHLTLTSQSDQQELEFTPQRAGEFPFHCPHYIYQGVMTVLD